MNNTHEMNVRYLQVEEVLAKSLPFGASDYLNQSTWSRYIRRLEILSEYLPTAGALATALNAASEEARYRLLGDPTMRSSINTGLVHFRLEHKKERLHAIEEILEAAQHQLSNNPTLPPLQVGVSDASSLGTEAHDSWIWTNNRREDASTRHFHMLVERELGPAHLELQPASATDVATLKQGTALLKTLLPQLGYSALNHAHLIAIVAHPPGFLSVTNPQIPGVVFLSSSVLSSPWKAAEYLLHESMHLKFLDAEHTHTLLTQGHQPKDCLIRPPWRRPHTADPYLWPLTRVLTVSHVYAALSLFFSVVEQHSSELTAKYGPVHITNLPYKIRQSLDRAEYLSEQLLLNEKHLGKAGCHFARWLNSLLDALDPLRHPVGSYLHLVADLYDSEAANLASSIFHVAPEQLFSKVNQSQMGFNGSTVADVLSDMLQNEIKCVQEIAERSGQKLQWTKLLSHTIAQNKRDSPAELAALLLGTRALLCQTLQKIPANRYTAANEPLVLDELLLNSSRHIEATRRHLVA